jgi:hypothetical protein
VRLAGFLDEAPRPRREEKASPPAAEPAEGAGEAPVPALALAGDAAPEPAELRATRPGMAFGSGEDVRVDEAESV